MSSAPLLLDPDRRRPQLEVHERRRAHDYQSPRPRAQDDSPCDADEPRERAFGPSGREQGCQRLRLGEIAFDQSHFLALAEQDRPAALRYLQQAAPLGKDRGSRQPRLDFTSRRPASALLSPRVAETRRARDEAPAERELAWGRTPVDLKKRRGKMPSTTERKAASKSTPSFAVPTFSFQNKLRTR